MLSVLRRNVVVCAPLGLAPAADLGLLMADFSFACFVLYAVDLAGQGSLRLVATVSSLRT